MTAPDCPVTPAIAAAHNLRLAPTYSPWVCWLTPDKRAVLPVETGPHWVTTRGRP